MKTIKIATGFITILAFIIAPMSSVLAAPLYSPAVLGDPQTIACRGLAMTGMGCATSGIATGNYTPKPVTINFDPFTAGISNSTTSVSTGSTATVSKNELKNTIANAKAPKDLTGQKINIVSVASSPEIYMLVKGQKHAFPSLAVFYDYGYTLAMIQPINQDQLDKYPRAKLLKVKGDAKIYYLTEGGLVRQVFDTKKIFDLYGDRVEDVITISRKEFNFYPANEYVYQYSPFNRDVFQVSAEGKRYLTPMAVARLGIRADQVAPISQAEMNSYKTLPPVID